MTDIIHIIQFGTVVALIGLNSVLYTTVVDLVLEGEL